jgi:hypothetical protein
MANTKPIGVAYSDQDISGADQLLSSGKLGFTTAAQGAVTQATSKATGVTLSKAVGAITLNGAALAFGATAFFTLTNSLISANDTVILTIASGATQSAYNVWIGSLAAGSCTINIKNITAATNLSEAVVINFALIHCD